MDHRDRLGAQDTVHLVRDHHAECTLIIWQISDSLNLGSYTKYSVASRVMRKREAVTSGLTATRMFVAVHEVRALLYMWSFLRYYPRPLQSW